MTSLASPPARPGRDFRELLRELTRTEQVRGGLIVATDGLVIAAGLPPSVQVESVSALAATLGRELELRSPVLKRGAFLMAAFEGENGLMLLGTTRIGFLVVLAEPGARPGVRTAFRQALAALASAWGGRPPKK